MLRHPRIKPRNKKSRIRIVPIIGFIIFIILLFAIKFHIFTLFTGSNIIAFLAIIFNFFDSHSNFFTSLGVVLGLITSSIAFFISFTKNKKADSATPAPNATQQVVAEATIRKTGRPQSKNNAVKNGLVLLLSFFRKDEVSFFRINSPLATLGEFQGEKSNVERLFKMIRRGESCHIVGGKKMGKSWMLECIQLKFQAARNLDESFCIGQLHASDISCPTEQHFVEYAIKELYEDEISSPLSWETFELVVKGLKKRNKSPVLLIDQFEHFQKKTVEGEQVFTSTFFLYLKALQGVGLVLIIANQETSRSLADKLRFSWSIDLPPLSDNDIKQFIKEKSKQAHFAQYEQEIWLQCTQLLLVEATPTDQALLRTPLLLQVGGRLLEDHKRDSAYNTGDPSYRDKFKQELKRRYDDAYGQ